MLVVIYDSDSFYIMQYCRGIIPLLVLLVSVSTFLVQAKSQQNRGVLQNYASEMLASWSQSRLIPVHSPQPLTITQLVSMTQQFDFTLSCN